MSQRFDQAHFDHMTGGDAALQREIALLFRAQIAAWTQLLQAGANWREAVHTMKGSARGIGLWQLAEACELAERVTDGDAAALDAAFAAVRSELDASLAALEHSAAA